MPGRWMGCVHLAEDGEHVVVLFRGDALGEHGGNGERWGAGTIDCAWLNTLRGSHRALTACRAG